jgi:hypothetical protein
MNKNIMTVLLFGLILANSVSAIDPGRATGTLKIEGKSFQLKYANIMQYNNEEGFLDKPETRLVLTDKELPYELLSGPTLDPLLALAQKNEVHGILLKIEELKPFKKKVIAAHGTLLYPPKDPRASFSFFTISDSNGIFSQLQYGQNRVGGKIRQTLKGDLTPSFEFDVSFSVPFFEDVVSSKLIGKTALASPQVKAVLAYNQALRKGDFETAKKLATPDGFSQLEAYIKQAGKAEVVKMLQSEPDLAVRAVYVRGNRSYIVIKSVGGRSVQRLVKSGQEWKID